MAGFASADGEAASRGNAGDRGAAWHGHRGVVLLRAVDAVRRLRVRDHVVELGRRLVVNGRPALAAVLRDHGPAVVPVDDPVGILRIDPEVVMIAVRYRELLERVAAIVREPRRDVEYPHRLRIRRVRVDVVVVPGALSEVAVLTPPLPGLTEVVGAEDPTVLGLDDRVHAAGLGGGRGDTDLAEQF